MKNIFDKYTLYIKENGRIVDVNSNASKPDKVHEAFLLFKEWFNTDYGSINETENLISIHSGGWSDNEELIMDFKDTWWWFKYHEITARGGHYYFNTDIHAKKRWEILDFYYK